MTKNWSFVKIRIVLVKSWVQWSYLKITIATKSEMSIPFVLTKVKLAISSFHLLPKRSFAETWNQASDNLPDLCACLNTHIGMILNTIIVGVKGVLGE